MTEPRHVAFGLGATKARALLNACAQAIQDGWDVQDGDPAAPGVVGGQVQFRLLDSQEWQAAVLCAPLPPGARLGRAWPTRHANGAPIGPPRPEDDPLWIAAHTATTETAQHPGANP